MRIYDDYDERPGNDFLCAASELPKIIRQLEAERDTILQEMREMFGASNIEITLEPTSHIMGWAVEATLSVNGDPVRHYEFARLCFMELNELMLSKMLEAQSEKEVHA